MLDKKHQSLYNMMNANTTPDPTEDQLESGIACGGRKEQAAPGAVTMDGKRADSSLHGKNSKSKRRKTLVVCLLLSVALAAVLGIAIPLMRRTSDDNTGTDTGSNTTSTITNVPNGRYEPNVTYDLVVYGDSSGAVTAAVRAKREGLSVVLVNPTHFLGGLTASGLGATDFGSCRNQSCIGGIAEEFYSSIADAYGERFIRNLEPHVGQQVFNQLVINDNVTVFFNEQLNREDGVDMDGARIDSITTLSGKKFKAKMFIDTTYVGDLMAAAGVSYTVGRESEETYNESLAGVRRGDIEPRSDYFNQGEKDHFIVDVDPYKIQGDTTSGLLPYVTDVLPVNGQGDKKIQAYNYRMCLTRDPSLRVPITKPEGYNEMDHELLLRNFEAGDTRLPALIEQLAGDGSKVDWNSMHAVGTDYAGANYEYPEATYERRREIEEAHKTYIQGHLWTLANSDRVDKDVRGHVAKYGLAADEFVDNDHWPYMMYIREARRMVSDYIMTQHNAQLKLDPPPGDSVGLGTFGMDSHAVQYFVDEEGHALREGVIFLPAAGPYQVSYRSIVPKKSECENLFVPVCLSCSHVAHGSIRMEPVFMILAESAATAALIAIDMDVAVQDVDYSLLRDALESNGQELGRDLD